MVEIHSAKPAMEREDRHLEEEIPTHVQLPFDFIWGLYMDLYHIYIYTQHSWAESFLLSLPRLSFRALRSSVGEETALMAASLVEVHKHHVLGGREIPWKLENGPFQDLLPIGTGQFPLLC